MIPLPSRAVKPPRKPPRRFFLQSTLTVARELIGMHLVHAQGGKLRRGRIVETEAYQGPADLAAHSARGRTARTEVMYGPPGHAYVYLIYGFWNCLNVVTARAGVPHAVLLRALEPLAAMSARSFGPGLLCRALHVDRALNGVDLLGDTCGSSARRRARRGRASHAPRASAWRTPVNGRRGAGVSSTPTPLMSPPRRRP